MTTGGKGSYVDITEPRNAPAPSPAPHPRRRQVLALAGGGYRGLYSAHFLELAETHYKLLTASRFELVIGTSIGGLIAAALAVDTPASVIVEKMRKHGPAIFRRWPGYTRIKQTFFKAPYSSEPLKAAVIDTLGSEKAELPLSAIDKPLAINAVNFTHGRHEIFRSKGLAGAAASATTLVEAVLASAAAPTYFPARTIDNMTLIDGGLIANAPELVGVTEVCGKLQAALDEVYVLAIGTAARRQGAALSSVGRPSTLSWMVRRALFQATLAAQEALVESQCRTLLGDRYHKVDREPLENQVKAIRDLDRTSKEATTTLLTLAAESWRDQQSDLRFRNFFER